jgi:hypothetical protein
MSSDRADRRPPAPPAEPDAAAEGHPTTPAERALAEAAARRAEIDARAAALPSEHGAKREREPVRYGDWENKGLASDF